jgi:hypothetical protein
MGTVSQPVLRGEAGSLRPLRQVARAQTRCNGNDAADEADAWLFGAWKGPKEVAAISAVGRLSSAGGVADLQAAIAAGVAAYRAGAVTR